MSAVSDLKSHKSFSFQRATLLDLTELIALYSNKKDQQWFLVDPSMSYEDAVEKVLKEYIGNNELHIGRVDRSARENEATLGEIVVSYVLMRDENVAKPIRSMMAHDALRWTKVPRIEEVDVNGTATVSYDSAQKTRGPGDKPGETPDSFLFLAKAIVHENFRGNDALKHQAAIYTVRQIQSDSHYQGVYPVIRYGIKDDNKRCNGAAVGKLPLTVVCGEVHDATSQCIWYCYENEVPSCGVEALINAFYLFQSLLKPCKCSASSVDRSGEDIGMQTHERSWKAAAGRTSGRDGYKVGDATRIMLSWIGGTCFQSGER
jgi:hypothetical protein